MRTSIARDMSMSTSTECPAQDIGYGMSETVGVIGAG